MSALSRSTLQFESTDPADMWLSLSSDHPDLLFAMLQRFEAFSTLSDCQRERAVAALLDFEAGLPEKELRSIVGAEMRALASMPTEAAAAVLKTIETFQRARPAAESMRRTVALQGACRDLTLEELNRLEALVPNARELAGLPVIRSHFANANTLISQDAIPRRRGVSRLFSRP